MSLFPCLKCCCLFVSVCAHVCACPWMFVWVRVLWGAPSCPASTIKKGQAACVDGSSVHGLGAAKLEGRLLSVQTTLAIDRSLGSRTTNIASNPAAGELRRHELDGVWLRRTLEIQRTENAKALALAQQKRETNLAKQTVAGLRTLGLNYDVTALAIIFRLAFQHANDRTCAEAQKPEVQQALAVLDAALRFDSRRAAAALGLPVQRRKTFGYAGSSGGSLSGSTKV